MSFFFFGKKIGLVVELAASRILFLLFAGWIFSTVEEWRRTWAKAFQFDLWKFCSKFEGKKEVLSSVLAFLCFVVLLFLISDFKVEGRSFKGDIAGDLRRRYWPPAAARWKKQLRVAQSRTEWRQVKGWFASLMSLIALSPAGHFSFAKKADHSNLIWKNIFWVSYFSSSFFAIWKRSIP